MPRELRIEQRLAAGLAMKDGDRDAPNSLARDAPVRPSGNHVGDPLFAPFRRPLDFVDCIERSPTQLAVINADEPLIARTKDDRVMAAPAMWVRVSQRAGRSDQGPSML